MYSITEIDNSFFVNKIHMEPLSNFLKNGGGFSSLKALELNSGGVNFDCMDHLKSIINSNNEKITHFNFSNASDLFDDDESTEIFRGLTNLEYIK